MIVLTLLHQVVLGLLPIIPIALLSIYYVTILASIRKTTESLHKQRQIIKIEFISKFI